MATAQKVVVVGAGVSGLTSALCLAEAGWPVRVWGAAMPLRTTSAVAGAVWAPPRPGSLKTREWSAYSLRILRELAGDPATGVRMAPALIVADKTAAEALPPEADLIPDLLPADAPQGFDIALSATLPMIDMPHYLRYLTRRLDAAGCVVEPRHLRSLDEAADTAPIVVNCAGLDVGALAGDDTVRPVFGQHVVLSNPGVRQLCLELRDGAEWLCYFPHPQRVVCGGIAVPGRWDTSPDPEVSERILQRCRRIEPRLGDSRVIETITGLRPDRPSVRVEAESLGGARGQAVCVHNYGHGSNGVTLSWGCARDVVRLVEGVAA